MLGEAGSKKTREEPRGSRSAEFLLRRKACMTMQFMRHIIPGCQSLDLCSVQLAACAAVHDNPEQVMIRGWAAQNDNVLPAPVHCFTYFSSFHPLQSPQNIIKIIGESLIKGRFLGFAPYDLCDKKVLGGSLRSSILQALS